MKKKANKFKNIFNKIFGYILNILLIIISIIILIGFYYIYQIKIEKKDYANMFGYTFFEVATGSMYPTIEIGDVVIVEITKDIKQNDIIVYKDEKNFITHRIIQKDKDKLVTKGDANNSQDSPIGIETVLGKVINIIPKVGIYRKILLTPEIIGLILILITIISIICIYSSKMEEKDE